MDALTDNVLKLSTLSVCTGVLGEYAHSSCSNLGTFLTAYKVLCFVYIEGSSSARSDLALLLGRFFQISKINNQQNGGDTHHDGLLRSELLADVVQIACLQLRGSLDWLPDHD